MHRTFLILFAVLIQTSSLCGQTKIPLPSNKSETYEQHQLHYSAWLDQLSEYEYLLDDNKNLNNVDLSSVYYSRFNTYFKMLPDEPSDILYIFLDAFAQDRSYFCYWFKKHQLSWSSFESTRDYYGDIMFSMAGACKCVYNSYNKTLIEKLQKLKEQDQRYRQEYPQENLDLQLALDSLNIIELDTIIDQYGYLNRNIVGLEHEDYALYIILNSDLETLEKYRPLIQKNMDENLLSKYHYPNLIDKMEILKGNPQVYGTQRKINPKTGLSEMLKCKFDLKETNKMRKKYLLNPLKDLK